MQRSHLLVEFLHLKLGDAVLRLLLQPLLHVLLLALRKLQLVAAQVKTGRRERREIRE